jgi:Flp pilus assembly pilin Flp
MVQRLSKIIWTGFRDEEGASIVEYILLAILIGLAAIAGLTFLGKAADNRMNNIAVNVQTQPS